VRDIFTSVCTDFESELVEFNGEYDHAHLFVNYPPKVAVSALMNSLKGVSSRMPPEELSSHAPQAVGRCPMVAIVLRAIVRGCAYRSRASVPRTTANAALALWKDGYTLRAILPRSEDLTRIESKPLVMFPEISG
jgi:REP element-mobilizing transposase RayT